MRELKQELKRNDRYQINEEIALQVLERYLLDITNWHGVLFIDGFEFDEELAYHVD